MSSVNNIYTFQLNLTQIKIKCLQTSNTAKFSSSLLSVKSENARREFFSFRCWDALDFESSIILICVYCQHHTCIS